MQLVGSPEFSEHQNPCTEYTQPDNIFPGDPPVSHALCQGLHLQMSHPIIPLSHAWHDGVAFLGLLYVQLIIGREIQVAFSCFLMNCWTSA